jgi:hypothetical protein
MNDFAFVRESGMGGKLRLDLRFVADKDEAQIRMTDERNGRGRNDHAGTVVPAHGVKRYGDWSTHSELPIWKTSPSRGFATATPEKQTRINLNDGQ